MEDRLALGVISYESDREGEGEERERSLRHPTVATGRVLRWSAIGSTTKP